MGRSSDVIAVFSHTSSRLLVPSSGACGFCTSRTNRHRKVQAWWLHFLVRMLVFFSFDSRFTPHCICVLLRRNIFCRQRRRVFEIKRWVVLRVESSRSKKKDCRWHRKTCLNVLFFAHFSFRSIGYLYHRIFASHSFWFFFLWG